MDIKEITPEEFAGWCAWREWVRAEYDKYLPQYREWHLWRCKLLRERHWPWWKRAWMYVFGPMPQEPKVCPCVLGFLADSFSTRPYYTDDVCGVHARQFGIRRCYSEEEVDALVKKWREIGR